MAELFKGLYFRLVKGDTALALIPSVHSGKDEDSIILQAVTPFGSLQARLPQGGFYEGGGCPVLVSGRNYFGPRGIVMDFESDMLSIKGRVDFGGLQPLSYDIMGPLKYLPLPCRHSVYSMDTGLSGSLAINGREFDFTGGRGYIEGDRGSSFPKKYIWSQSHFEGGSLMMAAASLPAGIRGVTAAVMAGGKEYRLASYLGASAAVLPDGGLLIKQGDSILSLKPQSDPAYASLSAPRKGVMDGSVRESVALKADYEFIWKGKRVFAFQSPCAAYENEYPLFD